MGHSVTVYIILQSNLDHLNFFLFQTVLSGLDLLDNEMEAEDRQKKSHYMKEYRKKQSPIQKKNERETSRKRVANWRASKVKETKTRKASVKERENMRACKARYRANISEEKKEEINQKRRAKYRDRVINSGKVPRNATVDDIGKCISRTPEEFASTIKSIIASATPKRKDALAREGIVRNESSRSHLYIVRNLTKTFSKLKMSRKKRDRATLKKWFKHLGKGEPSRKFLLRAVPLKWSTMKESTNCQAKPHGSSLTVEKANQIKCWYEKNSTCLAQKKTVLRTGEQRMILNTSIKKLHTKWDGRVSLSKFRMLRPKHILTMDRHKFNTCLCDVCLSVSSKLRALRPYLTVALDKYDVVDATLCTVEKNEYHKMQCIERQCPHCGSHLINNLVDTSLLEKVVTWDEWENRSYEAVRKSKDTKKGPSLKKKVLVKKEATVQSCMSLLAASLDKFALHLFNATYQAKAYTQIKELVPEGTLVTCEDFAENWRTQYQDEPTSVHYCYEQATVYTTSSNYKCPHCTEIVCENIIFVSDDLKHDAYFVHRAHELMAEHFKKRGLNINKHILFSDGCAGQFKGRTSFYQLVKKQFHHTEERHFFGSKHGKSACDALGGLIKRKAEDYVKSRAGVLRNATELCIFAKDELKVHLNCEKGQHKPRDVIFIDSVEHGDDTELVSFQGTRSIHQVRRSGQNSLEFRNRSCFCKACLVSGDGCMNSDITGPWKHHKLVVTKNKTLKCKGKTKVKPKKSPVIKSNPQNAPEILQNTKEVISLGPEKVKESTTQVILPKKNPAQFAMPKNRDKVKQYTRQERLDIISKAVSDPFSQIQRLYENFIDLQTEADLLIKIINTNYELPESPIKDLQGVVDESSWELMPPEVVGLVPLRIYGDGNCFARCISHAMFGSETSHPQMRVRLALQMASNEKLYLDPVYLSRGLTSVKNTIHYKLASYLDNPEAAMGRIDEEKVKELYRYNYFPFCLAMIYLK